MHTFLPSSSIATIKENLLLFLNKISHICKTVVSPIVFMHPASSVPVEKLNSTTGKCFDTTVVI